MTHPPHAQHTPVTVNETVDGVLRAHASAIGPDLAGYRHHVYRVLNLAIVLARDVEDGDTVEKLAVAAVHHDLGIWTHHTFDYLSPSIGLASTFLAATGRSQWAAEIAAMIAEHHRVTAWRATDGALVEALRRADWADVTFGVRRFGLSHAHIRSLYAAWPDAGFHRCLVRLAAARLRSHPWSPLPMVRW